MTKLNQNVKVRINNLQDFLSYAKDHKIKFCDKNANELTEEEISNLLPFGLDVNPSSDKYLENCLEELKHNEILIKALDNSFSGETFDLSQFICTQSPIATNSTYNTLNTIILEPTYSQSPSRNLINDTIMEAPSVTICLFTGDLIDFNTVL